jgi:hypothetical protein
MTERRHLTHRTGRATSRTRRPVSAGVPQPETVPPPTPLVPAPDEPSLLGFPAEVPGDEVADDEVAPDDLTEAVDADGALYVVHTADATAGALLMVAGAAGGMSLFLPWAEHGQALGLTVVRRGLASTDVEALAQSGLLLPVVVALGGGVLFVLGLLAFRPARSHRLLGVAALLVALGVAAGIVVRVADLGWDELRTDPGVLCAVVLAGAGVLGALKAMLTPPEVTTDPR